MGCPAAEAQPAPRPGAPAAPAVDPLPVPAASSSPPVAGTRATIREEDLLLLAVDLDGLTLTDALPAYGSSHDPLLPLGELARLLELDVSISPAQRRVTGRLGQSQTALTIDLRTGVGRLGARDLKLSSADVAVSGVEIYVRASALERILPIAITVDVEALQLTLKARETLPVQSRLKRVAEVGALRPEGDRTQETLRIVSPYALISPPAFDVTLDSGVSAIAPRLTRGYDIRVGADLFYTGFQGYVGSDQNGAVSSVRATVERHDVNGGLLGPINATRASAGDIYTPGLPIGARSVSGRGFTFSNAPLEQTSVFNRIDLRGDLPIGYDVQLYINDVLRAGQRTALQGRYEFLNVPLAMGQNVIRIVLNGPTGQRTEQTRIINVGGGQLKKGALTFEVGAAQQDTPLITVQRAPPGAILAPGQGTVEVTANAAYGLTEALTLIGGVGLYAPTKDRERGIITFGARTSTLGAAVRVGAAADSEGGAAVELGLAAQTFGVSAVLQHLEYFRGFIDETVGVGSDTRPLTRHSQIDLNFNARTFKGLLTPVTLGGSWDDFADRSSNLTGALRSSATLDSVLLSGGLNFQSNATRASVPGAAPGASTTVSVNSVTTGNLSASTFYRFKWQLRANLDYNVTPKLNLGDLSVTADRALTEAVALHLGAGQSLISRDTTVQAGANLHSRYGDLSLTGAYSVPTNVFQIGISLSFGLAFDPYRNHYIVTRPGPGSGGSLAFQSFIDPSGSGAYEAGDRPVARVAVDGGERKGATDAHGRVFITGLGSSPTGQVQVGLDDIDDPDVSSPPRIITFTPRAGLVVKAPFPMSPSSELIAHVVLRQGGGLVGLSAVRVRLTGKARTPPEASTEFDGTAAFEQLGTGAYNLELDPEQARRLHMRLKDPVKVVVPATGGALPDVTAEVVFDQTEAAGSAGAD